MGSSTDTLESNGQAIETEPYESPPSQIMKVNEPMLQIPVSVLCDVIIAHAAGIYMQDVLRNKVPVPLLKLSIPGEYFADQVTRDYSMSLGDFVSESGRLSNLTSWLSRSLSESAMRKLQKHAVSVDG